MIQSPEKEKEFLIQLQKDLIEDRKENNWQADPVYYGIQDFKDVVTAEGYEDKTEYYNDDDGDVMTIAEIFESLKENYPDKLQELENFLVIKKDENGNYCIEDQYEFGIFLNENTDIKQVFVQNVDYIRPDLLFLTRKDAQDHLKTNSYHYSKDAQTYSMTAWRSPRYEHLIELLRNGIDFEKSTIVLKEPSNTKRDT